MVEHVVEFLVESAMIYAVVGLLFAIAFAWRGAGVVDAVARHPTLGFRALVVPGAMLLWPLLAMRWWRAVLANGDGALGGPRVPGDRTDLWSVPCERLRPRALAMWLVLAPILAALLVVAWAAHASRIPKTSDASSTSSTSSASAVTDLPPTTERGGTR